MVGGRQLKSRKSKLREMLGQEICLKVRDDTLEEDYLIKGILEFNKPDKGYFLKETETQIVLPYVKSIDTKLNEVLVDLTGSLLQCPEDYLGRRK